MGGFSRDWKDDGVVDAPIDDVRAAAPIVCARNGATISENPDGSYHLVGSDARGSIDATITLTPDRDRTRFQMVGRVTNMPVQIPEFVARIISKGYRGEIQREARKLRDLRLGSGGRALSV